MSSPTIETTKIRGRYLGHPVMFPRSTAWRRLMCRIFGHDWVEWYVGAEPLCYDCGARATVIDQAKP